MANLFVTLPTTTVNGSGADVDVSGMGGEKTVKVEGSFRGMLSVEISLDGGTTFQPVVQFTDEDASPMAFAADRMRVTRSGIPNGMGSPAPVVTVGANDNGAQFLPVPVPSRPGVGAGVDVSALGSLNTVTLAGPAGGANGRVVLELSDNNVDWTEIAGMSFGAEGVKTRVFTAQFVRMRREGGPVGGMPAATNVANIGAANDAGAGGGGGAAAQGLVFQPGGGGSGPVFFDVWADLMTELTSLRTTAGGNLPIEIWFDESQGLITVPAGSYEMENVTWRAYAGRLQVGEYASATTVTLADEVILPNLSRFVGPLDVEFSGEAAAPPVSLTDAQFVYLQDVTISATGAGGGAAFFNAFGLDAGEEVAFELVRSRLNVGAADAIIEAPPNAGNTNYFLRLVTDAESRIGEDSITTGALVSLRGRFLGAISPQANVSGGVIDEYDAGLTWEVILVSSPFPWLARVNNLLAVVSGVAQAITLPPISPFNRGKQIVVKENTGAPAGNITITPDGADTIDGAASHVISLAFVSRTLVSDGVDNWIIV
jgi:hypothetical protein